MTPGKLDFDILRHQPFDDTIVVPNFDWSAATLRWQFRLTADAPGAPLLDLALATPPADGLSATVATTLGVPTTTIRIIIGKATIAALLPYPANGMEATTDRGPNVRLVHDLHVTPVGGTEFRLFEGIATLVAGSTRT